MSKFLQMHILSRYNINNGIYVMGLFSNSQDKV